MCTSARACLNIQAVVMTDQKTKPAARARPPASERPSVWRMTMDVVGSLFGARPQSGGAPPLTDCDDV